MSVRWSLHTLPASLAQSLRCDPTRAKDFFLNEDAGPPSWESTWDGRTIFDPEPFAPEEFDLMLTGSTEDGPFTHQFMALGAYAPLEGDNKYRFRIYSPEEVRKGVELLCSFTRDDFAADDIVASEAYHSIDDDDQDAFYEELANETAKLQQLFRDAADAGQGMIMEVIA